MPVAHGFYQNISTLAYPHLCESYWREQHERGMTTAAISGWGLLCPRDSRTGMVLTVEAMMKAGLASVGQPLLVFAEPDDLYWARQKATCEWPEVVLNNCDDPAPADFDDVFQMARAAHRLYFRSSLFVNGNLVKEGKRRDGSAGLLGEPVDCWIVQAHTWQQDTEKNARALGKELWAGYTLALTGQYEHMRYFAGLWCWARRPKQALVWCYTHDQRTRVGTEGSLCVPEEDQWSLAIPRPDGTVQTTLGYEGYEQGIKDCRYLEHREAAADEKTRVYLSTVRNTVPFAMPRPGRALPELRAPEVIRRLGEM